MPEPTTPELLSTIAAGGDDGSAWRILVERHQAALFWTARTILASDADAEDAVQEVLLLISRNAARFRLREDADVPEDHARRWLLRVAANCALVIRRRERRRRQREMRAAGESVAVVEAAEPDDDGPDARETLRQALASMDERQRRPVVLHYLLGLDYQAMATDLGCTADAARNRLRRSVDLLRRRLLPASALLLAAGMRADAADALDGLRAAALSGAAEPHPCPANWFDLARTGLRPHLPPRQIFGGPSIMLKLSLLAACLAVLAVPTALIAGHVPAVTPESHVVPLSAPQAESDPNAHADAELPKEVAAAVAKVSGGAKVVGSTYNGTYYIVTCVEQAQYVVTPGADKTWVAHARKPRAAAAP